MMCSNKLRCVVLFLACFAMSSRGSASELGDGMQLYFDGNYHAAKEHLQGMLAVGHTDARLHYFRGLTHKRLGELKAADADFKTAARMELAGDGYTVGVALQRVQGADRLHLERYRTLARLSSRRRLQPIPANPIVQSPVLTTPLFAVPRAQDTGVSNVGNASVIPSVMQEGYVQHATATSPLGAAGFRLASEVPLRHPQHVDPIVRDPGLAPDLSKPNGPSLSSTGQPVGTGVAKPHEINEDDLFADVLDDAEPPTPHETGRGLGVLGAVFRAMGKATLPQIDPRVIMPQRAPTTSEGESVDGAGGVGVEGVDESISEEEDVFGGDVEDTDDPFEFE